MMNSFTTQELRSLRQKLRNWYSTSARELPWRKNRDPYSIWVGEIMLQQTQVTTVIPYYLRFMNRFPTVGALAQANEQEVLRYWEGLGYYRRARNLHQAAKIVVHDHQGIFPHSPQTAKLLPGLGRYTTGAILSQAFDKRLPAVDANIARIIIRLGGWQQPLESTQTQAWLWQEAEKLLPTKQVGNFNQALMELGQVICAPKNPTCLLCPLRELCKARAQGLQEKLPLRKSKKVRSIVQESSVIIQRNRLVLVGQRRADSRRWAKMWEFPTFSMTTNRGRKLIAFIRHHFGITVGQSRRFTRLQYGITRFRVQLQGWTAQFQLGKLKSNQYQQLKWIHFSRLNDLPFSVPQRRLAKAWLENQT